MRFVKLNNAALLILAFFLIIACHENKGGISPFEETAFKASKGFEIVSSDKTLSIHLAVNETYCKNTACKCVHYIAEREYYELQDVLKEDYNIDLELTYFSEPYHLDSALIKGKFDGVICKPWLAFKHVQEHGFNYKRIADILDVFDNQWLTGVFIAKKGASVKSLNDINGKVLASGRSDAYEKYHTSMNLLKKKGIEPLLIVEKASCLECINLLLDDKADVAVVSDYALFASCAVDVASEDNFKVIGKTEKSPICSVILDMAKVNESDALRLQKALLDLSGDNSLKSLHCKGFVKPAKWVPVLYTKNKTQ